MKCRLLFGILSLLLLSLAPSVAAVLVYSTTIPATAPGFSVGFALPAFDSNLGTLDDVAFSYSIAGSGSVEVFNDGSVEFGGYGGSILSTNLLSTPSNVGPGLSPEVILVSIGVGGSPPPGSSTASGGTVAAGSVDPDPLSYGNWAAVGGGSLGFNLQANGTSFQGGGSPNYSFGTPSMVEDGTFTVTYTYTPVPEPSTVGLLMGIAALGFLSKRSRLR